MKTRNYLPCLFALTILGILIVAFPPFQITWRNFFFEQPATPLRKFAFLLKVYGLPMCLSFLAIVLMQMQGRLASVGATATSVFPIAFFGAAGMMTAFRSMVSGVGGVPGYAVGMALAYTVMSRMHSIQPTGRIVFGRPMLRIVWRGELEAQKLAVGVLQSREASAESAQRSASTSTSNSAKNNSLSLSRAEAGMQAR
jgi:hypothetical protein